MRFVCEKNSIKAKQKPDIKSRPIVTSTLISTIVNTEITTLNILKPPTRIITHINSSKARDTSEKTPQIKKEKTYDKQIEEKKLNQLIILLVAISVCLFATIGTFIAKIIKRTNYSNS